LIRQRTAACFKALATGDAVGKQTETLTRAAARQWYPNGVQGFHGEPGTVIPRYAGKRYEWRVGEITDDTEQTIAIARALLETGEARHEAVGAELLRCKKSVHPGLQIWEFQQAGDPARKAVSGDGCGAAMRVAPVGVIVPDDELEVLVRAVYEISIPTHGGQLAIAAAAAVAAAISAALRGKDAAQVLHAALSACRLAESLYSHAAPVRMSACIETIHSRLAGSAGLSADDIAQQCFPDNPATIVPLAIGLAVITASAQAATLIATNVGGDSDSVASIGSAIAGALRPESVNEEWFRIVRRVNFPDCDDMLALADALVNKANCE
jgi:ADP-ribosylglycohydrolase